MSCNCPPYEPKALANQLLDWADEDGHEITPLKLQKLLFFIHSDYLKSSGVPLLDQEFEAWSYGPVLPSVYREFKQFSGRAIRSRAKRFDPILRTEGVARVAISRVDVSEIRRLYFLYVPVSAGLLSHRSHHPEGPWAKALEAFREHRNINRTISNDLIVATDAPQA